MLRFNTFRAERYFRSKFVEGKFLLASEATDLELEILDLSRSVMKRTVGDVAIDDAWKVEKYRISAKVTSVSGNTIQTDYSDLSFIDVGSSVFKNGAFVGFVNSKSAPNLNLSSAAGLAINDSIEILTVNHLLVRPGEAWMKGLPFFMRSGLDQTISLGIIRSDGSATPDVTLFNEPYGNGKILRFTTLDTSTYRIVISAQEEIITNLDDPFLKNANLSESTAQKIRLLYKINIVPESFQTETPLPYKGSGATDANLVNQIKVTGSSGGNGELISINVIGGSEQIDGRDIEVVIRNDSGVGSQPIPFGTTDQQAFFNGSLIDSVGNEFHINAVFNDTTPGQVIVRIDKEVGQVNPQLINGKSYRLVKRDVFVTDDSTGTPQGVLWWPVAKAGWSSSLGFKHSSVITDMRDRIISQSEYQDLSTIRFDLRLTAGGTISYGITDTDLVTWSAAFSILNPYGIEQTIAAQTVAIYEGGSIIYDMNLPTGGALGRGSMTAVTSTAGTSIMVTGATPDLSKVRVGNVVRWGTSDELRYITSIDSSSTFTINSSVPIGTIGETITIYMDSFGPGLSPKENDNFVLATRKSDRLYLGNFSLGVGESTQLGVGITAAILTFIGAADSSDSDPAYTSVFVVTQGSSLVAAISALDAYIEALVNAPLYDERILYPSGLPASSVVTIPLNSRNSNQQETYVIGTGDLKIFINGLLTFEGEQWSPISTSQIVINYDLTNDTEIHFRKDNFGGAAATGGGGGGGSGSLQDAYNIGRTITVSSGLPVQVDGASGVVAYVKKDLQVDGLII